MLADVLGILYVECSKHGDRHLTQVLDSRVSPLCFFSAALLLNIHTRISPSERASSGYCRLSKQKSRKNAKAIIGSYDDALFLRKNTHTQTPPTMKKTRISHPEKQTNKEKKKKKQNKQDRPNRSDLLVNNIRRVADKESLPPSTEKKKLLQLSISPSQ